MPPCVICQEVCTSPSACLCASGVMHAQCAELMHQSNRGSCGICLRTFDFSKCTDATHVNQTDATDRAEDARARASYRRLGAAFSKVISTHMREANVEVDENDAFDFEAIMLMLAFDDERDSYICDIEECLRSKRPRTDEAKAQQQDDMHRCASPLPRGRVRLICQLASGACAD